MVKTRNYLLQYSITKDNQMKICWDQMTRRDYIIMLIVHQEIRTSMIIWMMFNFVMGKIEGLPENSPLIISILARKKLQGT